MKAFIKRHFGGTYRLISRVRGADFAQMVTCFPNRLKGRILITRQEPYVCIEIGGRMGFGAMLTVSACIFNYCDQNSRLPYLKWTNPLYSRDHRGKEDWLGHYFIRTCPSEEEIKRDIGRKTLSFLKFTSYWDLSSDPSDRWQAGLTIERAHALFNRHLAIREEWLLERDRFAQMNFGSGDVLGIHYRGTDKIQEAPRVQWENVKASADQVLATRTFSHIFVATDEPEFLKFIVEAYGRPMVVDLGCREIYSGSQPAHFTTGNRQVKAYEALMTILLLAKCKVLIRTPSHLSAWAKILNPDMEAIVLTKTFERSFHFPEREFWKTVDDPALPV
jgi:hypothetical protein